MINNKYANNQMNPPSTTHNFASEYFVYLINQQRLPDDQKIVKL